jgi:hypothetical protein
MNDRPFVRRGKTTYEAVLKLAEGAPAETVQAELGLTKRDVANIQSAYRKEIAEYKSCR